jgi:hypothetical protein
MPVFANILVASELEEAAINTMVTWLPTYLREVERQLGIQVGTTPMPEHYSNRNSFDYVPGEKYPKVVAISPGLADTPLADGRGQYRANWRLGVGAVIAATTEVEANLRVKIYGAAFRQLFIDKQSLNGHATAIRWVDEDYPDLPIPNQNMLFKAAATYFTVDCQDVATKWGGPTEPDDEPYAYGIVEHVIIDLEKIPVEG